MFNQIKQAAKKNPKIWEEMAEWFSKVSPTVAAGVFLSKTENR